MWRINKHTILIRLTMRSLVVEINAGALLTAGPPPPPVPEAPSSLPGHRLAAPPACARCAPDRQQSL